MEFSAKLALPSLRIINSILIWIFILSSGAPPFLRFWIDLSNITTEEGNEAAARFAGDVTRGRGAELRRIAGYSYLCT